jgi:hypothetical protein
MRISGALVIGVALGLFAGASQAQPTSFVLLQNFPNPFCPVPGGDGPTTIQFATPQLAEVSLTVLSPDGTTIVRTSAGLIPGYSVYWDGLTISGSW